MVVPIVCARVCVRSQRVGCGRECQSIWIIRELRVSARNVDHNCVAERCWTHVIYVTTRKNDIAGAEVIISRVTWRDISIKLQCFTFSSVGVCKSHHASANAFDRWCGKHRRVIIIIAVCIIYLKQHTSGRDKKNMSPELKGLDTVVSAVENSPCWRIYRHKALGLRSVPYRNPISFISISARWLSASASRFA